jgi:OOP family OmpA-OmpF porin
MRMPFSLPSRPTLLGLGAACLALALSALVGLWAAVAVEARSAAGVRGLLAAEGVTWASVRTDGLRVHLSGLAPNEAARFRAVNLVGGVVDAGRIRDGIEVAALAAFEAPRFSVEILRNLDGVSLIGLVPGRGEGGLSAEVATLAGGLPVADMLEAADFTAPPGWEPALDFGMEALRRLDRAKISIAADRVAVTAITDSADEKARLAAELARLVPPGLKVEIDLSAPRPVLTPFTLRFVLDAGGARFDACSADTARARERIVAAGVGAGAQGKIDCTVGLGTPSPRWAEAAEAALRAVAELGAGTVTFSDADIALIAPATVDQALFDRAVGELQAALPPAFSLNAQREAAAGVVAGPAEFTATLTLEGRVELRGRLADPLQREAVDSLARAYFGAEAVYTATRLDPDLPDGWPLRVMAGLEALAAVDEGALLVRADRIELTGRAGRTDASDRVAQVLTGRLGADQVLAVAVRYDEALDPVASQPTPEECAAELNAVVARRKITFTPGSAEIDTAARGVIDALAEVLRRCAGLAIEVAGHTDSQGSESGNQALSQSRAEAVLAALQGRGLPVEGFSARGYGEARPIADNGSETGREANRRIEFVLVVPGAGLADAAGDPALPDGSPGAAVTVASAGAGDAPKLRPKRAPHAAAAPAAADAEALAVAPAGEEPATPAADAALADAALADAAPADAALAETALADANASPPADGGTTTVSTAGEPLELAALDTAPEAAAKAETEAETWDDTALGQTRGFTLPAAAAASAGTDAGADTGAQAVTAPPPLATTEAAAVLLFAPTEATTIRPQRRPAP